MLLPLNKFLASTPFSRKLLLVSRWPLAQIGWLPKPPLGPVPPGSSALTPGERIATPVKLPVGSGMVSICAFPERSRSWCPPHSSTGFFDGDSRPHLADFQLAFTVTVRSACTIIEGIFWVWNPSWVKVTV